MPGTQRAMKTFQDLRGQLAEARSRTDRLFDMVKPEYLYERPIPARHRIIFYIGHLEAFDWNLLRKAAGCRAPWHPEFDKLFAFGIDPVDGGLPTDQPKDWPTLEEVRRYDEEVRRELDAGIEKVLRATGENGAEFDRRLHVAVEHRLMHEETLSYMFQQLPYGQKRRQAQAAAPPASGAADAAESMIEVPSGRVTLGLSRNDTSTFGWDNEYEAHEVEVPAFAIDRHMVTNGEYMRFVEAGGYGNRELWAPAAWDWRSGENVRHPLFWKCEGEGWVWRGMFEEMPLPADWPVYVSHAEASAYAQWVGKTLPSESQWQRAAYGTPDGEERAYPWGDEEPSMRYGNFDFERWDPASVAAYPDSRSAFGVEGLLGNGWEWTASVFGPFPGFAPFAFYPGYSANFFDGKHYTMKGGSSRTAASMLRKTFRNWFQPHYPYVYAGFRCVSA
jgi:iron(II)-dependent oxidoreductase